MMKFSLAFFAMWMAPWCSWAQNLSTVYDFGADKVGATPLSAVVRGPDGKFYGERGNGHGSSFGTVFAVNADGTGFTNLYSFTYGDGAFPKGGLILSGNTLYGTTYEGGANGFGTIFAINTDSTGFTNLYNFGNDDGAQSEASLLLSGQTLYGCTYSGGAHGYGTVFAINTDGSGFTNLHSFSGSDGGNPESALILSVDTLYGASYAGGSGSEGSLYSINTNGTGFDNFYSFTGFNGIFPHCRLVLSEGTLYGTTLQGGSNTYGEVFAIKPNGTGFVNLYSFKDRQDGGNPESGLVLSGNTLYGTATSGGVSNWGAIFAIHTDGTGFTNLYSFAGLKDGGKPGTDLVLTSNLLYGTASAGGTNGNGTLFSLSLPSVAQPLPELGILLSGNSIILSWPGTGYALKSATNLVSPLWSAVSPAPVLVGGLNTVTNPISEIHQFFRLSQ